MENGKEPYISVKEPYITLKEHYIRLKERRVACRIVDPRLLPHLPHP